MHQESPNIKHLKLRIPMQLYFQIKKDADEHGVTVNELVRFRLAEAEARIPLDADDFLAIAELVRAQERKLHNPKPTRSPRNLSQATTK